MVTINVTAQLNEPGQLAAPRNVFHALERGAIEQAMVVSDDNVSEAARLLGIARQSLQRKLRAMGR